MWPKHLAKTFDRHARSFIKRPQSSCNNATEPPGDPPPHAKPIRTGSADFQKILGKPLI